MIRLGLCCLFRDEPIRFRNTTATATAKRPRELGLARISDICRSNAEALLHSLHYCHRARIGCFRVTSQIMPLRTHPTVGYVPEQLPDFPAIFSLFQECRDFAQENAIRLALHPDQFVVLASPNETVVANSMSELAHHGEVAAWIGADVINIHVGGSYGDKCSALERFAQRAACLSDQVRSRLTIENDDVVYNVRDLLPFCMRHGIPLVYDVHHHRCNPDDLTIAEASRLAKKTWNREPLFHISSPKEGWKGPAPRRHHDFINPRDFPDAWLNLNITVEVEAKAKELAVLRLQKAIERMRNRKRKT